MTTKTAMAAIVVCLLIALANPAEAKKRYKTHRIQAQESAQCVLDNSGRQVCGGTVNRVLRASVAETGGGQVVAHPTGCPRRLFCGCGVSVKVFGKPVRDLFLASNWLKFPRAAPGAGMVAARRGHVFYILAYNGDGTAQAYDPNSGGGRTRIHTRSLAGYRVVDPHGSLASL